MILPQVPVAALVQRNGQQMIGVTTEAGEIRFRPVKVASTDGPRVNIAEGVAVGERIAIHVPSEVADGAKIRMVPVNR